jgi:hypothetical protein
MKKQSLLKLILVAWLGMGGIGLYLWWTIPKSGINRASLSRVRKGMTKEEVEAIIGMPPGDYRKVSERWPWGIGLTVHGGTRGSWTSYWHADEHSIIVEFVDCEVSRKRFYIVSETIFDKLLTSLHITEPNEQLPMVYVY